MRMLEISTLMKSLIFTTTLFPKIAIVARPFYFLHSIAYCLGLKFLVAIHQPDHLLDDAASASKKLGNTRAERESYLFKSLLDSNALVAFGSDWPVADINPLNGIKTAMRRRPPTWNDAWNPSECISLDDAIKA
ncbi:Amidohydrolase 3 [Sesbania bispinosa]|nr:Amidohydrolase 3 [Sesbania bispinosa]